MFGRFKSLCKRFLIFRSLRAALAIWFAIFLITIAINFTGFVDFVNGGVIGTVIEFIILVIMSGIISSGIFAVLAGFAAAIGAAGTAAKQIASYRQSMSGEELMALEKERMKVQIINIAFFIGFIMAFVFFMRLWPAIAAVGALSYFKWIAPMNKKYRAEMKEKFVRTGLEDILENFIYRPDSRFSYKDVSDAGIFTGSYTVNGSDYIEADYGKIHFSQSNISLNKGTGRFGTNIHDTRSAEDNFNVFFRGRMMRFDFPEDFPAKVWVISKDFNISAHVREKYNKTGDQGIKTEIDSFNRRFYIAAPDDIAAMRVLTPQVLEGIARLGEQIKRPLAFSFAKKRMYAIIGTGSENAFEATVMGDTTLTEERKKIREEIELMIRFLDNVYYKQERNLL